MTGTFKLAGEARVPPNTPLYLGIYSDVFIPWQEDTPVVRVYMPSTRGSWGFILGFF